MYPGIFPSSQNPKQQEATYSEKLLVGYRWYDHHKVTPAFPFGHGLVSREIVAEILDRLLPFACQAIAFACTLL